MSTAEVITFPKPKNQPIEPPKEVRVADCDNGYTRLANELYDSLIAADLNRNEMKVAHAVCRRTYGFNKKVDRISDSQIAMMTNLSRQAVSFAKNTLIRMKILVVEAHKIGPNKIITEWDVSDCHRKSDIVRETMTKSVRETMTQLSEKPGHTKDTLKDNKDNTPLPPCGGSQSADAELPDAGDKKKSSTAKQPVVNYQAFADSYNEILGDRLPTCAVMSDKRKRALKKLLPLLKAPTLECFSAYLNAFAHTARPFYFGDNDRGWRASFDFVLRQDTLTATKEGSIADSRLEIEGDDE